MPAMLPTILIIAFLSLPLAAQDPVPLPQDEIPAMFLSKTPPEGLPKVIPHPTGTPPTPARAQLGRRLFFDPILSIDRKVSCASCHDPRFGFSRPEALPRGVNGKTAARNAPTLLNRAFGKFNSWDGRAATLEKQVLLPIENPLEMDLPLETALSRLKNEPSYATEFAQAFDKGLNRTNLARALSLFIRTLTLGNSPVDRFRSGEVTAMTPSERAGFWIYESKGRCWRCHSGPNFTDESFHNTGVGALDKTPQEGRQAITYNLHDRGRFKTPTLRGLTFTAPYMHDGSLTTLEQVVAFYRRGGTPNTHVDPVLKPLDLDDNDAANLVAFLKSLSATPPAKKDPTQGR